MSGFVRIEKKEMCILNCVTFGKNGHTVEPGLKGLQGTCRFILYELSEKQKQTKTSPAHVFVDLTNKADNL